MRFIGVTIEKGAKFKKKIVRKTRIPIVKTLCQTRICQICWKTGDGFESVAVDSVISDLRRDLRQLKFLQLCCLPIWTLFTYMVVIYGCHSVLFVVVSLQYLRLLLWGYVL